MDSNRKKKQRRKEMEEIKNEKSTETMFSEDLFAIYTEYFKRCCDGCPFNEIVQCCNGGMFDCYWYRLSNMFKSMEQEESNG